MEFRLNTSSYQYPDETDRKLLQEIGFEFAIDEKFGCECKIPKVVYVSINSIEDLMVFVRKFRAILLMEGYLEIYD